MELWSKKILLDMKYASSNILLQVLIDYWELDADACMLDGQPMKLKVKFIYFITRLSCRGDVVNLET